MSDIQINKEQHDVDHGRYVARIDGIEGEGELTYSRSAKSIINADHTGVPDNMSGRGVAKALYNFMLDDARATGFRIIPICPFVRKQFERQRYEHGSDVETLFTTENPR